MKVKKLLDSINPLNDMVLFFLSKKKDIKMALEF